MARSGLRTAGAFVAALALAGACDKSGGKQPVSAGASTGSAGSAAAGSASAGGSADACTDAMLEAKVGEMLTASKRYFDVMNRHAAGWQAGACEAVRVDLLGMEADADRFMTDMMAAVTWAKALPPDCRARLERVGDAHPIAKELEAKTPELQQRVEPILEACRDHPGFQEAAGKGLRLMKKKAP